jgi:hypothetical protein
MRALARRTPGSMGVARATARMVCMRRSSARFSCDKLTTTGVSAPARAVNTCVPSVTTRGRPRLSQRLGILRADCSESLTRQPPGSSPR